ncbi:3-isopropylmalate dehydratase small subunit [bacterium]|nr:3-isopropylmalate dehydratase small subunit [bacterium]NIN91673.1 3-isopropylmalate dehydratase small subunit [bacterium]NIO18025.1 3-isopropylmalate dehydratase small subunit [bacterium]NIO72988.1 3-isopropylmalate dehydratase small subunit [bacterium]
MEIKATAHKFGDNINTDDIIPARYLNTYDPKELARHCMEGADEEFVRKLGHPSARGHCIVAGKNFGCGSSREQAPLAIKGADISCVIAESFARIFYRNAINIGLPILESERASKRIDSGDEILIDLNRGKVTNLSKKENYKVQPFPEFIQEIIRAGGLMNYAKEKLKRKRLNP